MGASSSTGESNGSSNPLRTFLCGPEGEEFFPLCRHSVVDENADPVRSGKPGAHVVSVSRAARSGAAGLDGQETMAYMTMQGRLHTKITGIQVEDTSKTLLLQSMHHKEEVGRTKPLPGDSNEPSVHDKSADELHSDEDGEPRLNIDLAALIENNRDNEFLARLLQGDSPGADPRKIARDRSGAKPPITSEATLVTPSP
eukprot:4394673-Amphidinium_carterae.1